MKNFRLIVMTVFFFSFFISCANKEIEVSGYGYRGDNILVLGNRKVIFNILVSGNNMDSNKLCSFYETKLKVKNSTVKLNFRIDSSGISVLDTTLIIPKEFKTPLVTFVYPSSKSKFKRVILLEDNSMYIKY